MWYLTDTGGDSELVHSRKRPKVDRLFSSLVFRRVRATSMTQRRVENTRVHFWTLSPVSVKEFAIGIFEFSGFWNSEFFENFQIPIQNSEIFGILHFGVFRDFQIPMSIPGISGFVGSFELAQNEKSGFRIPWIRIRDPEKISSQRQLCS